MYLTEYIPKLSTLVQLLQWRAALHPKRIAFTFLSDVENDEVKLSYGELDRRARAIGAVLQGIGERGSRALLLYPTGIDYIAAFFGCLYAGRVAVPAYPPRLNRNIYRLQAIIADARPVVALTTSQALSRLKHALAEAPELGTVRLLPTDSIEGQAEEQWREPDVDEDTLAFLQYTSGSTSEPKGVMLSHRNLIHNSTLLASAFEYTPDSRCVSWLPIYHDMGLIGGVLQPLFGGFHCALMSPASFLQRPLRWLQAVSRERVTISGGPNFAYELCAQKIEPRQREELDLSSWSVAFNGSEPIRPGTIEKFTEAFAPCGFRREAFLPCYGLAEATLIVSGGPKANPPVIESLNDKLLENHRVSEAAAGYEGARLIVGCGRPFESQRVVIVRPETLTACAPEEVGEIWVAGPSVAQGYWNRAEETAEAFQARLADTNEGPFLRTGDLGFLKDGELFVTGRLKDLIIIRGLNYYPQDIELTVEKSHHSLRPGCGAAFSVELDGEERLIIVQEVSQREQTALQNIIRTVREAVAEEHEIKVHAVALIKPGTIPKTSSGKIQRHACRNGFLAGELKLLADWKAEDVASEGSRSTFYTPHESAEAVEAWLRIRLAEHLRLDVESIDTRQPITRYGLDSLDAIELVHSVESELGIALPVVDLLEGHSIRQLAQDLHARLLETTPTLIPASSEKESATHPLSVGQSALWFLHRVSPESAAYNITSALRVRGRLDTQALRRVFQKLSDRHAQLRATFITSDGEPLQLIHKHHEVCFETETANGWSEAQLRERLIEEAHRSFDLERGPLFRIKLFTRSEQEHILLVSVHHIVADLWSLGVLMREMKLLYEAEKSGMPATLAPLELQYIDYVHRQRALLSNAESAKLWTYWQNQLAGELPLLNLPLDKPRPALQTYRGSAKFFKLGAELTRDLKNLSRSNDATLYMTLLAAFQVLLHRYTNQEEILVGTPSANRSSNELASVVGYFVNPLVMRGRPRGHSSFKEFLKQIRRTVLEALSHQDMPFALLIEKLQPHRDPSRSPLFQTMFALQKTHTSDEALSAFALDETQARTRMGELDLEAIPIELSVAQFDLTLLMTEANGGLVGTFQYNTDLFEAETISRLSQHFETLLQSILVNPQTAINSLSLLTEQERQQQLFEWNQTAQNHPTQTLHQLFESQAERTPEATALVFEDEQLSYRELNERANQLAHYLQKLGVGPEVLVGISMERSIEMPTRTSGPTPSFCK
ncbi:MAG: AMP-binding protein [Pyrinomonadaceae bacterium]|nr:AMP-binding protein [Pyrinomonadaceae bacterium]MBD0372774.1 AMP-binding protein [Pyrinomonadaceae bacterium]